MSHPTLFPDRRPYHEIAKGTPVKPLDTSKWRCRNCGERTDDHDPDEMAECYTAIIGYHRRAK